ncbi:MAG: prolyl oligopeptidase family serine peptidase [Balneolaceae bacterium]
MKRILQHSLYLLILFLMSDPVVSQGNQPYDYMDIFDTQYISDPQISPDGNTIAFTGYEDQFFGYQLTRLTRLNENLFTSRKLGEVTQITYPSSFDGREIQGWIVTPPDFDPVQKYPLILEIHGGPYLDYGPRFTPEIQLKATRGYVVLYTNPRGSTGYGEEFASYINHNYPSEDYDDLMSGVDYMLNQGYIDEDQLFITGGSGGGVLTSWSIGKTDRFAAAAVSKPVINWYSFSLTADNYPFFSQYWFAEYPWDDPQQYLKRSPISLVGNVTTPTLLLTGEEDYRTPMSETEQYYNALRLQEIESMMIRIPETSHSIAARPSNLIRKVAYIVGWFDRYRNEK